MPAHSILRYRISYYIAYDHARYLFGNSGRKTPGKNAISFRMRYLFTYHLDIIVPKIQQISYVTTTNNAMINYKVGPLVVIFQAQTNVIE